MRAVAGVAVRWTDEEDAKLRSLYADSQVEDVAQRLGRTVQAVRKRAQVLKLQSWRFWSDADRARLREAWGKVRTRELAKELGRTPNSVKQQAMKMGLDSERYYTAEEKDLLRELYPTHTAAQIAERIHGTGQAALAIYRMAHKLGLRKWPHWEPEVIDQVRELHGQGLTDPDIGRRMGLNREQVHAIRYERLKLPKNVEAIKEAGRRAVKAQQASLGVANAGELRALSYRRYAAENGWPEDLRPREVQILNVLAAKGVPMTKHELAAAIGMPTEQHFKSGKRRVLLSGNGPGGTYTASLARRGLLTVLKRGATVTGKGRGRSMHLYCLGPLALAHLEERSRCQEQTALSS